MSFALGLLAANPKFCASFLKKTSRSSISCLEVSSRLEVSVCAWMEGRSISSPRIILPTSDMTSCSRVISMTDLTIEEVRCRGTRSSGEGLPLAAPPAALGEFPGCCLVLWFGRANSVNGGSVAYRVLEGAPLFEDCAQTLLFCWKEVAKVLGSPVPG